EVKLGLLPGSGGTQRLPRIVGIQQGLTMILTGKQLRPKQARKAGLVDDVIPRSILLVPAKQLKLSSKPQRAKAKHSSIINMWESTSMGRNFIFKKAGEQAQAKAHGNYPAIDAIIDSIKVGQEQGFKAGL